MQHCGMEQREDGVERQPRSGLAVGRGVPRRDRTTPLGRCRLNVAQDATAGPVSGEDLGEEGPKGRRAVERTVALPRRLFEMAQVKEPPEQLGWPLVASRLDTADFLRELLRCRTPTARDECEFVDGKERRVAMHVYIYMHKPRKFRGKIAENELKLVPFWSVLVREANASKILHRLGAISQPHIIQFLPQLDERLEPVLDKSRAGPKRSNPLGTDRSQSG